MKRMVFLVVFLFFSISLCAGNGSIDFNKVKFGMGGGLGFSTSIYDDYGYYGYTIPTKVVLPIQLFRYFRLEPVFSLSVSKYKDDEYGETDTVTNFMGGAGLFFTYPFEAAMINVGARLEGGINHYKSKDEDETHTKYRRILLAEPVIGADYFLNGHFSIGCEITLGFFYYGGTVYGEGYDDDYENDDSYALMIRTGGTLFFRFYFF